MYSPTMLQTSQKNAAVTAESGNCFYDSVCFSDLHDIDKNILYRDFEQKASPYSYVMKIVDLNRERLQNMFHLRCLFIDYEANAFHVRGEVRQLISQAVQRILLMLKEPVFTLRVNPDFVVVLRILKEVKKEFSAVTGCWLHFIWVSRTVACYGIDGKAASEYVQQIIEIVRHCAEEPEAGYNGFHVAEQTYDRKYKSLIKKNVDFLEAKSGAKIAIKKDDVACGKLTVQFYGSMTNIHESYRLLEREVLSLYSEDLPPVSASSNHKQLSPKTGFGPDMHKPNQISPWAKSVDRKVQVHSPPIFKPPTFAAPSAAAAAKPQIPIDVPSESGLLLPDFTSDQLGEGISPLKLNPNDVIPSLTTVFSITDAITAKGFPSVCPPSPPPTLSTLPLTPPSLGGDGGMSGSSSSCTLAALNTSITTATTPPLLPILPQPSTSSLPPKLTQGLGTSGDPHSSLTTTSLLTSPPLAPWSGCGSAGITEPSAKLHSPLLSGSLLLHSRREPVIQNEEQKTMLMQRIFDLIESSGDTKWVLGLLKLIQEVEIDLAELIQFIQNRMASGDQPAALGRPVSQHPPIGGSASNHSSCGGVSSSSGEMGAAVGAGGLSNAASSSGGGGGWSCIG